MSLLFSLKYLLEPTVFTLLSVLVTNKACCPPVILKLPITKILGILSPSLMCWIFHFFDPVSLSFLASSFFHII